jgi:phospho-N-acetylmuramoyl-pentapeptide-transferase
MIFASITSLLFVILLGPKFIRFLKQHSFTQRIRQEEAPQLGRLHQSKGNTPTMGGVLILVSLLLSLVLWMDLSQATTMILLFITMGLGLLGFFDDYLKIKKKNTKGISPKKKLFVQCFIALCICAYLLIPRVSNFIETKEAFKAPIAKEIAMQKVKSLSLQEVNSRLYIPFFKRPFVFSTIFALVLLALFYVFLIVGTSNAVNLTDGLDGLAAGCLILTSTFFAILAYVSNNFQFAKFLNILYFDQAGEIAVFLSALSGAVLGFLWFNCHPAQLFMGDVGSLTLGGILGVCAILLKREILLAFFGAIFVFETLSVMIQIIYFRYTKGGRFFRCAPIHHHFEYGGLKETKVVIRFWIIALLFALFGLLTLKIQ